MHVCMLQHFCYEGTSDHIFYVISQPTFPLWTTKGSKSPSPKRDIPEQQFVFFSISLKFFSNWNTFSSISLKLVPMLLQMIGSGLYCSVELFVTMLKGSKGPQPTPSGRGNLSSSSCSSCSSYKWRNTGHLSWILLWPPSSSSTLFLWEEARQSYLKQKTSSF